MATLRELRVQATELGVPFEKTTNAVELQDLILTKMVEVEMSEPTTAPVTAPPATAEVAPAAKPKTRTPVVTPVPPPEIIKTDDAPAPTEPYPDPEKTSAVPTFESSIEINEGDLNAEFKKQATLYNSFATIEAIAKAKTMTAKLRVEVVHAEQFKKFRLQFLGAGEKPTEKMIESEISSSIEYQAAQRLLIEATQNEAIAKGAKESIQQRRDMLIQLGSSKRQEIDQIGMSVRDRALKTMTS